MRWLIASTIAIALACGTSTSSDARGEDIQEDITPIKDTGESLDLGGNTLDIPTLFDSAKAPEDVLVSNDTNLPQDAKPSCPDGVICIETLPFSGSGTTQNAVSNFDTYSCAPDTDESGPEVIYQVTVEQAGFLTAAVTDEEGVDVDVHLLKSLNPDDCIARGHHHAAADVDAGTVYIVVDSFVKDGTVFAGNYQLQVGFTIPSVGPCATETGIMKRVGDGGNHLAMPATGPVVMEAHLVTQEEPKPYPMTSTEKLESHYALSQSRTGFVMHRTQKWAPLEGGNFYGAGIGSPTLFPVEDEHWYVCMYWTKESRPARGTRMIMRLPGSQRAVVVAAGYETGPGDLTNIGGTTEETHFYLGTGHKSVLSLGIAADQSIPLGPRTCD